MSVFGNSLCKVKFSQSTCLMHILSYASVMVDFSSCRSASPDSCTSSTFCLVPPLWKIFLYMGQVLLTHASYAYLTLRLRHNIFFFKQVGFLDSRTLSIFCLMPLQWLISLHTGRVLFTHGPWAYFALCLCRSGFCFTRVEFSRLTRLRHIWPYAFTVTNFFSCWSGFSNSSALDTLCLVPPPWPISSCVYWVFSNLHVSGTFCPTPQL